MAIFGIQNICSTPFKRLLDVEQITFKCEEISQNMQMTNSNLAHTSAQVKVQETIPLLRMCVNGLRMHKYLFWTRQPLKAPSLPDV